MALFPFLVTDWNTWALATYSLGVAADLCFFTKGCPAVSVSVSSATRHRAAARRSAVSLFGSKQEVTDWDTWDPAAVLNSD